MSFREQTCPGCGVVAFTHCRYCHSRDHDKTTCPALLATRRTEKRRKDGEEKTSDTHLSISVQPSPHDDIAWRELQEDVRNVRITKNSIKLQASHSM